MDVKGVKTHYTIVSDVNIWISIFRTPAFRKRCRLFFQPPCGLLYSTVLLEELDKVVHRPKHWNVIDRKDYTGMVHLITGDDDLLILKEFGKTKIMQLTEFIELMKK